MVANGHEINLIVDGKQITTIPGKTVLEAALESQIYIPYLCYHPGMKPFAACRMCMVREEIEIEVDQDGQKVKQKVLRPPTASCALPVRDGMVIQSNSNEIRELQTDIMEMVIAEHPHGCLTCHRIDLCGPGDICLRHVSVNDRCVTCPKNERCELKDTVRYLGMDINSPLNYQTRNLPVENGDPFYDRDYNLCIVCARCVRVCEEVRGDSAITFLERAGQSLVGTSNGTSLMQSGCEFCGACVDVCPVGALVETDNKWEKAANVEKTICNLCPVGCQVNLEFNNREKMIRVIPELNSPVNKGQACFRGKFGSSYINEKKNTTPKINNKGIFIDKSIDEIIHEISSKIPAMNPHETAVLVAPNISNESAYVIQKFSRTVLKTNNILSDTDNSTQSVMPLIERLGFAAATNSMWNIEKSDCIILINANITEEYNVLGLPIKNALRNGSNLITIDSRETESASIATHWIRPNPGSELILIQSIVNQLLRSKEIEPNTLFEGVNIDEYKNIFAELTDDNIQQIAGVSYTFMNDIIETLVSANNISIIYSSDNININQTDQFVHSIIDLSIILKNVFTENGGLFPLSQGSNQQGLIDMGCRSEVLPGHRLITNNQSSKDITTNIFTYNDLEKLIYNQQLKNLFIIGDIESFSYDHVVLSMNTTTRDAIDNIILLTPSPNSSLIEISDYIFPITLHTEEIATYTNLERRIQITDAIVKTTTDQLSTWEFLSRIANTLNIDGFSYRNSSAVMDEISSVVTQYENISHAKLNASAKVILKPEDNNPLPTQLLHSDKVLIGIQWKPEVNISEFKLNKIPDLELNITTPDKLILIPGRVLSIEGTEVEINPITNKNTAIYEKSLLMSPIDAQNLSINNGDYVNIETQYEISTAKVKIDPNSHQGFVYCTKLFAEYMSFLENDKSFNPMLKPGKLNYQTVSITKII